MQGALAYFVLRLAQMTQDEIAKAKEPLLQLLAVFEELERMTRLRDRYEQERLVLLERMASLEKDIKERAGGRSTFFDKKGT